MIQEIETPWFLKMDWDLRTLNDFLSSGAITHTVRVSIKEIINFYQKERSVVQIVHSTLIAQLSRKNLLIGSIKSTYIILTKYMYLKNDEHSMIFRQIFELWELR